MALEEVSSEEKGGNDKKETVVQPQAVKEVSMDLVMQEVILKLQQEVENLKKNQPTQQTSQATSPDTMERLVALLEQKNQANNQGFAFEGGYATEAQASPDDVLDHTEWVSFVSHFTSFIIVDDTKNGMAVRAPFKPIKFVYDSSVITAGENDEKNISNTCIYVCKSKKELEWLRGHSTFGYYFFDNLKDAKNITSKKAAKLMVVMGALNKMDAHQLIAMAREKNIHVDASTDAGSLRGLIAMSIIEEMSNTESENTKKIVGDAAFEAEMVGHTLLGMNKTT